MPVPPARRRLPGVLTRTRWGGALIGAVALLLMSGCVSSVQLTATQPSAVTQELVVRSLERSLAQLDVSRLAGRKVLAALYSQAGAQPFVKEFVIAWLEARQVHVVPGGEDLSVKVFASVVGTDHGETFIGIPALQAPIFGVPTPEIAIFKWARNRGLSELLVHVYDGTSHAHVGTIGPGVGRAKQDDFTFVVFIGFTVSDAEDRLPEAPAAAPVR